MNIKLNVPYSDKDTLKQYGIKWNSDYKTWYLQDYKSLPYVVHYLENKKFNIYTTDRLYIVEGCRECWKCSEIIPVYALGALKYCYVDYKNECWKFASKFNIIYNISFHSQELENVLKQLNIHNRMKITYSNTTQTSYLMNLCKYCGAKQGEHFLFNEVDSVFAPTNIKEAKELRIYEISLLFYIGFKGIL